MSDVCRRIAEFIQENNRFAILSHARPDGDSIGSQLALALGLEQLGKSVRILNSDPVPPCYRFLPEWDRIETGDLLEGRYDGLIVLECNSLERSGVRPVHPSFVINIDHHAGYGEFGDLNWIDPQAAAVAEMVFSLLQMLGAGLTPEMATHLYAGILTDTGSFRFSSTREETFRICSILVQKGADPGRVSRQVYMDEPLAKVRLWADVLGTLELHPSGRIAWITLSHSMMRAVGADATMTEGLVNWPLSVSGVELVAFFREDGDHGVRVSLRSKSGLNVGEIAGKFGGGGHAQAAGLSLSGNLESAIGTIVPELERLLRAS